MSIIKEIEGFKNGVEGYYITKETCINKNKKSIYVRNTEFIDKTTYKQLDIMRMIACRKKIVEKWVKYVSQLKEDLRRIQLRQLDYLKQENDSEALKIKEHLLWLIAKYNNLCKEAEHYRLIKGLTIEHGRLYVSSDIIDYVIKPMYAQY